MSLEPVFAEPLSVTGILLYRNRQYLDALRLLQKSLVIDIGLHESRYVMQLCSERLGKAYEYNQNLVRDGQIKPGKVFSWMLPLSLRSNQDDLNTYRDLFSDVYTWVKVNINESDFFEKIMTFLSKKIERPTKSDLQLSFVHSMLGHFQLAQAYLRLGNEDLLKKSDRSYEKSIDLQEDKSRSSSFRGRAEVNFLLGKPEIALQFADKSINYDPSYPYAYVTKGIIIWNQGLYDKASEMFSQAINEYLKLVKFKKPSFGMENFMVEELSVILNSINDKVDFRSEFRAWAISCYIYGYCPFDPNKKPFFDIKNGSLRISHSKRKNESSGVSNLTHYTIKNNRENPKTITGRLPEK